LADGISDSVAFDSEPGEASTKYFELDDKRVKDLCCRMVFDFRKCDLDYQDVMQNSMVP